MSDTKALADRIAKTAVYSGDDLDCKLYRTDKGPETASASARVFLVGEEWRDMIVAALRSATK